MNNSKIYFTILLIAFFNFYNAAVATTKYCGCELDLSKVDHWYSDCFDTWDSNCYSVTGGYSSRSDFENAGNRYDSVYTQCDLSSNCTEVYYSYGMVLFYQFYTSECLCKCSMLSCDACSYTDAWSGSGTIQSRRKVYTGTCSGNSCLSYGICTGGTIEYRCNVGYYGTPTSASSGCTSCKTATGNNAATSAAGSVVITQCYIPTGITDSDTSGSFQYTSNCYYE